MNFFNNVKAILYRHQLVTLITFFTLLWGLYDFNERFLSPLAITNKKVSIVKVDSIALSRITEQQLLKLKKAYAKYKVHPETKNTTNDKRMSLTEQLKQHGTLNSFYSGDKKLQLKAIFELAEQGNVVSYALIEISDLKKGIKKIRRFEQGTQIFNYRLDIRNNKEVILHPLTNKRAEITLIMYQKNQ